MDARSTIPAPTLAEGDTLHGFRITKVTPVEDICALVYEATHERTGAQVVHIHCNDPENMFSVGFRTPPPDSTGIAHILEHCVLAGSERYPVKDAFNELSKRTLNTFLNAMTWPDRTVYPVCSAVRADYFNLARVYADLAFNPQLKPSTFQQEGHHLEFATPGDPESELKISGVVYNEMKGAYFSAEGRIYRELRTGLSPDSHYGYDSGGDPKVMPRLTYEQFREFHRTFYSPSNARFLLYGDVEPEANFGFLAEVLEPFERVEVDSQLALQEPWSEPRTREIEYPVGEQDETKRKTFVTVSWLTGETRDVLESLTLSIALEALVGTSASPLYKALMDSGLGEDIFPGGPFEGDLRQGIIHIGMRGTEPEHAAEIERIIFETTQHVVDGGLDREIIEGAFHQIEFAGKEISPPFPIMLLVRANPSWYFDGDPKDGLAFGRLVEQVRQSWAADPQLFEKQLKRWMLDNPHRERLVAKPSTTLAKREEEELRKQMAERKATLAEAEKQAIAENAEKLRREQEEPDPPEAIATLPKLDVKDIPREVRTIPEAQTELGSVPVVRHDVFSNGIGYVGFTFDMRDLDDELAPYVPLFSRATFGMGAAGQSYEQVDKRIGLYTGGIGGSADTGRHVTTGEPWQVFNVGSKALPRNIDELMTLLRDLLVEPDPTDTKRLKDLLQEAAARSYASLTPRGHMYAITRAAASLHHSAWRREQWEGVTQVRFLREQANQAAVQGLDELVERIGKLQRTLFTRARLQLRVAGDAEINDQMLAALEKMLTELPAGEPVQAKPATLPADAPRDSGVVVPAQVQYVGQSMEMPNLAETDTAVALEMLSQIARAEYFYKKLRVQGGAYGGASVYAAASGTFSMFSYRDPNLTETLKTYEGLAEFVRNEVSDAAVEDVRIGAIGNADSIVAPGQVLHTARRRAMSGISDELRQRYFTGLMDVTADDIREKALPNVEAALKQAPRAVLGSREKLEAANAELERPLDLFSVEP